MIEVRWHGRGGQGSFTVARILGMAASLYGGKYAQAFPSFGPERRGAPVTGFTRINEEKITDRSELDVCDYVVILDETLWGRDVTAGLKPETVIIINTSSPEKYKTEGGHKIVALDATALALQELGKPITNITMMGALVAVSNMMDTDCCIKAIGDSMSPKIAEKNQILFNKAYNLVKEDLKHE